MSKSTRIYRSTQISYINGNTVRFFDDFDFKIAFVGKTSCVPENDNQIEILSFFLDIKYANL